MNSNKSVTNYYYYYYYYYYGVTLQNLSIDNVYFKHNIKLRKTVSNNKYKYYDHNEKCQEK